MNKLIASMLIHCIVAQAYCMQSSQCNKAIKPECLPPPHIRSDSPKICYENALQNLTRAGFEPTVRKSQTESTFFCYRLARAYLSQILIGEKGELRACLTPKEYIDARAWMAQLLADGLGGERDARKAKELCEDLLANDGRALPHDLRHWVKCLLKKLNRESAEKSQ